MKNKDICNKIKEVLRNKMEVLAIFNNGSSIVGLDSNDSDLDFVVILKNEKNINKITQIIRQNFTILKNDKNPEIEVEEQYQILNKRVDFTLISKKKIEKKVYSIYDSKDKFLKLQHFIKHKIIDAVIVYDPDNLLNIYQKEINKYPKKIFNEVFNDSIIKIKENLFYFKNHGFRNEFQYAYEQWEILQPICQALYAKNNRLFMLPFKRLHNDLKDLKPNIKKEMYQLIRGDNNKKTINKKIEIIKIILSKLEK